MSDYDEGEEREEIEPEPDVEPGEPEPGEEEPEADEPDDEEEEAEDQNQVEDMMDSRRTALSGTEAEKVIPKSERTTKPILFKPEFVNIVSTCINHLNLTGKVYLEGYKGPMDVSLIARHMIKNKKFPAIIKRFLPGKGVEIWDLDELYIDPNF